MTKNKIFEAWTTCVGENLIISLFVIPKKIHSTSRGFYQHVTCHIWINNKILMIDCNSLIFLSCFEILVIYAFFGFSQSHYP